VDGRALAGQVVLHCDLKSVAPVCGDERTRELLVNAEA
jgi:hypothetical protein